MLVILRENVENLGRVGDVVRVSDGYARNFLLPKSMVVRADEKNIAAMEHQKRLFEKKRQSQKLASDELAAKLNEVLVTIARKFGEKDKMFGSVSVTDIAEALKNSGFDINKKSIKLHGPIRSLGTHDVFIELEADITATIKVSVVKEE